MEFAVIKTGGKQYIVEPKKQLKIEKLEAKEGDSITFDQVLLIGTDKALKIGTPLLAGAKVTAKVLKQDKSPRVITFKYRSKSRYHKKTGHRQYYTLVEILKIS